jgi:ribosomal protein S18 acetylase RimI-like enzyme
MSEFPPNISIRPLTIEDADQCLSVETKSFTNAEERASLEKFHYRLKVCPELCSGLFVRDYEYKYNAMNLPEVAEKLDKEQADKEQAEESEELPTKSSVTREKLIGHVIATKIDSSVITSESMDLPSEIEPKAGHIETSRFIGIHSVAIDPNWQGLNLGTLLLHDYIQKLSNQDLGDKIAIIVHKELIPFYEKIGFVELGESKCDFAGTKWYDMAIDLVPEEDL